jgi:peptidoglycan/xylan/chitin deacetylase (PgdA/CDA1 family)
MKRGRTAIFRAGLDTLYRSRAYRMMEPLTAGCGIIFTLHRVVAGPADDFAPNRVLAVTPEFLDAVIGRIRENGFDIVSLDAACERIAAGDGQGRFACLTFDDGYRDNLIVAGPVLRRHGVPYAIYVATGLPDGTLEPWWLVLERAIAGSDRLEITLAGDRLDLDCRTVELKYAAYETVYWRLRAMSEAARRIATREIAGSYGIDMPSICRELSLTWDEIAALAADPMATIGAHTVAHPALASLSAEDVEREMSESLRIIDEKTGCRPRHFAYPYGDPGSAGMREFAIAARLGFASAVTTRPGVVFPEHAGYMTALPRVSLNGDYQALRYVDLFLSGAPFALWNRFRRVNAA